MSKRSHLLVGSTVSSHNNDAYRAAGRASMVAYERNPARHADQAPYDRNMAAGRVALNTYFDDERETTIDMDRTIQGERLIRSVGRAAHDAYTAIFNELPKENEYDREADYLAELIALGNNVGVRNDPAVVAARTAVEPVTARRVRISKDAIVEYIGALTTAIISAAYIAAGKAALDTYHSSRNRAAASERAGRHSHSRRKTKSKNRKRYIRTSKLIK